MKKFQLTENNLYLLIKKFKLRKYFNLQATGDAVNSPEKTEVIENISVFNVFLFAGHLNHKLGNFFQNFL